MKINSMQTSIESRSIDIFVSGCRKIPKCTDCHNPSLWDFDNGEDCSPFVKGLLKKLRLTRNFIRAVRIMGGEPADQKSEDLLYLLKSIKDFNSNLETWVFTGWELDRFVKSHNMALPCLDFIKTGEYIKGLSTKEIAFDREESATGRLLLASCNQRVYRLVHEAGSFIELGGTLA